jgi:hypothetical protein
MTEVQKTIVANANPLVDTKTFEFRFKKDKLGNKRANVKCEAVPVPSAEGLVEILTKGGKELELLLEVAADTVRSVLADIVGSNEDFDPAKFDFSAVLWEKVANMPKEDRRSSAIATEIWEGFVADYIAYMPGATAKTLEQVTLATEIYVKKMAPIKSNKTLLGKLKEQIALYSNSPNAEQFQEVIELLVRRTDNYLTANEAVILEENL